MHFPSRDQNSSQQAGCRSHSPTIASCARTELGDFPSGRLRSAKDRTRQPALGALYFAVLVFCSLPSSATQCVYVIRKGSDVPTLSVDGYDLVFAGKVKEIQQIMSGEGLNRWPIRTETTFEVERVWHGDVEEGGSVVISSRRRPMAHDRRFQVGQQQVLLAKEIAGLFVSPVCSPPSGPEDENALVKRIESEYGEDGK